MSHILVDLSNTFYRARFAINGDVDNAKLDRRVNCGVPNGVPAPKLNAPKAGCVGAGVAKGDRVIDRNAANEILRMIVIKALGAVTEICGATGNNLDLEFAKREPLSAIVA